MGNRLVWPIENQASAQEDVEVINSPGESGRMSDLIQFYKTLDRNDKIDFLKELSPKESEHLQHLVTFRDQEPLNEQAPWVDDDARRAIKKYGTINTDLVRRLNAVDPEHHYSIYDGDLVTRKRGGTEKYRIEENGFSSPREFVKDVRDIEYDVLSGLAGAGGSLAGAAGGAAATGNPFGVIAGGVGGGGVAGGFMEYNRQIEAVEAGLQDDVDWEQVGTTMGLEGAASLLGVGKLPAKMFGSPRWAKFAEGINKQMTPIVAARRAVTDATVYPQIPGHVLNSYRNQFGHVAEKEGELKRLLKASDKSIPKEQSKDMAAQGIIEESLGDLRGNTGKTMQGIIGDRFNTVEKEIANTGNVDISAAKNALEDKKLSIIRGRPMQDLSDQERDLIAAISHMEEKLFTIDAVADAIPAVPSTSVFDPSSLSWKEIPGVDEMPGARYRAEIPDILSAPDAVRKRREADDLAGSFNQTPTGVKKISGDAKQAESAGKASANALRDALRKANPNLGRANDMYSDARNASNTLRKKRLSPDDWHKQPGMEKYGLDDIPFEEESGATALSLLSPEANIALGRIGGTTHKDQINTLAKIMREGKKGGKKAAPDLLDKYEKTLALKEFLVPDKGVKSKWGATSTSNTLENIRAQSLIHNLLGEFQPGNVPVGSAVAWGLTSPSLLMGSPKGFKNAHKMSRKFGKGYRLLQPGATRAGSSILSDLIHNENQERDD